MRPHNFINQLRIKCFHLCCNLIERDILNHFEMEVSPTTSSGATSLTRIELQTCDHSISVHTDGLIELLIDRSSLLSRQPVSHITPYLNREITWNRIIIKLLHVQSKLNLLPTSFSNIIFIISSHLISYLLCLMTPQPNLNQLLELSGHVSQCSKCQYKINWMAFTSGNIDSSWSCIDPLEFTRVFLHFKIALVLKDSEKVPSLMSSSLFTFFNTILMQE